MSQHIIKCPHCKQFFKAKEEWVGKKVECPSCENTFIVEQLRKCRTPFLYGSIMPNILMIWGGVFASVLTFIFACGVYSDESGFHTRKGYPLEMILGKAIPVDKETVIYSLGLDFNDFCYFVSVILIVIAFIYAAQVARLQKKNKNALFLKIEAISAFSLPLFSILFIYITHKHLQPEDRWFSISPSVSFYLGVMFIVFSVVSVYAQYVTLKRKQNEFKNISIGDFIKKMIYFDA